MRVLAARHWRTLNRLPAPWSEFDTMEWPACYLVSRMTFRSLSTRRAFLVPPWSGNRDFHREKLLQVYEFLIATPVAEIQQEDETAGNTADAFEARGCFAVCEADLCADVVSTASS
jgi:hypothetical protein